MTSLCHFLRSFRAFGADGSVSSLCLFVGCSPLHNYRHGVQPDCLVILDDHPFSKKALVQNEIFSASFLASSQVAPNLGWSPTSGPCLVVSCIRSQSSTQYECLHDSRTRPAAQPTRAPARLTGSVLVSLISTLPGYLSFEYSHQCPCLEMVQELDEFPALFSQIICIGEVIASLPWYLALVAYHRWVCPLDFKGKILVLLHVLSAFLYSSNTPGPFCSAYRMNKGKSRNRDYWPKICVTLHKNAPIWRGDPGLLTLVQITPARHSLQLLLSRLFVVPPVLARLLFCIRCVNTRPRLALLFLLFCS